MKPRMCRLIFGVTLLLFLSGCLTRHYGKAIVLAEYSSSMSEIFCSGGWMPVVACKDGYVIASCGVIYRVREEDFANPIIICDARPSGWGVAARHHDAATLLLSAVTGLIVSPDDKIYYCDGKVNKVENDGSHKVLAGSDIMGFLDSPTGTEARFGAAFGLCWRNDRIVVTDTINNALREIDPVTGEVRTLFGSSSSSNLRFIDNPDAAPIRKGTDGNFDAATLCGPRFVLCDDEANIVTISNSSLNYCDECSVRYIDFRTRIVSTLAVNSVHERGLRDGPLGLARIGDTSSATIDGYGNIYLASGSHIRKIDKNGLTTTIYCTSAYDNEDGPGHSIDAIVYSGKHKALIIFDGGAVKSLELPAIP